jgi:hypothetical protein
VPFTPSHAAAVLPLLRTPLPASALVAGSLAPDLPYYLSIDLGSSTHTAGGLVGVDLVMGLALWACWHGIVATPAIATAPRAVRARLVGNVRPGLRRRLSPGPLGLTVLAVVVGAATHVGWDEFTHAGRFGPDHLGVLADTWAGRPGHRWAQEASGLLGAAVLAWWLRRWWSRTSPSPVGGGQGRWWPVVVIAGAALVGGASAIPGTEDLRSAAVAAAFRGGGWALAAVLVLALGWHVRTRSGPPAPLR